MSISIATTQTVLRAVEEKTPLDVVLDQRPITVEVGEVGAGTPLSDEIVAGLTAANAPSATNAFATLEDIAILPYKVYTAKLDQSGTNAPIATVLQNTLGVTLSWLRINAGFYAASIMSSTINANKIAIFNQSPSTNADGTKTIALNATTSENVTTITLETYDRTTADLKDGILSNFSIEIRVYP